MRREVGPVDVGKTCACALSLALALSACKGSEGDGGGKKTPKAPAEEKAVESEEGSESGESPGEQAGGEAAEAGEAADEGRAKAGGDEAEGGGEGQKPDEVDGPVARVDGQPIPAKAFNEELEKITSRGGNIPPDRMKRIKRNILKRLIERELVRQAVEEAGIEVTDSEMQAAMEEYKGRFQNDDQFENYLKHGRVSKASIKDRLRHKQALEKLIDKRSDLAVSDEEAKKFFEDNQKFYVEKPGVRARHVLIKIDEKGDTESKKKALEKAEEIKEKVEEGDKSFAELAKKHSEGPSASKGGDLGFFSEGQMVEPFEKAAFDMQPGEIAGPVKTRFGYHVIKVTDKRDKKEKSFDEVKDQIVESLKNKKFFRKRRELLDELRSDAEIERLVPFAEEGGGGAKRPAPGGPAGGPGGGGRGAPSGGGRGAPSGGDEAPTGGGQ